MSAKTKQMADESIAMGVHGKSVRRIAVASNLNTVLKSLGLIATVLQRIESLKKAVSILSEDLGMHVEVQESLPETPIKEEVISHDEDSISE